MNEFKQAADMLPFNTPVRDPVVLGLLSRHPSFIYGLVVTKRAHGRGAYVFIQDGKVISFHKAYKYSRGLKVTRPSSYWEAHVLRRAIQSQVSSYRRNNRIARGHDVDHCNEGEFAGIVKAWKQAYAIEKVKIRRTKWGPTMACPKQRRRFQETHRALAEYQAVSPEEHKRLTRHRVQSRNE